MGSALLGQSMLLIWPHFTAFLATIILLFVVACAVPKERDQDVCL